MIMVERASGTATNLILFLYVSLWHISGDILKKENTSKMHLSTDVVHKTKNNILLLYFPEKTILGKQLKEKICWVNKIIRTSYDAIHHALHMNIAFPFTNWMNKT